MLTGTNLGTNETKKVGLDQDSDFYLVEKLAKICCIDSEIRSNILVWNLPEQVRASSAKRCESFFNTH